MNVTYKCRCMADEATIAVPDRRDDEDVVHWVEQTVGHALLRDHRVRSPRCLSNVTEYVTFEVDPEGRMPIGQLPRQ